MTGRAVTPPSAYLPSLPSFPSLPSLPFLNRLESLFLSSPLLYMFRPIRERCPFANILSRSRKFCPVRELGPTGELANKHEFEMQLINSKLEAHIVFSPPYIAPLSFTTNSPVSSTPSSSASPPPTPEQSNTSHDSRGIRDISVRSVRGFKLPQS